MRSGLAGPSPQELGSPRPAGLPEALALTQALLLEGDPCSRFPRNPKLASVELRPGLGKEPRSSPASSSGPFALGLQVPGAQVPEG